MVLSTRLAHVLNHLITSLTTYLSNSREHVAKSGKIRQKTDKREQWTLPYFILFSKKKPDEEHFVIPRVKENYPPSGEKRHQSSRVPKIDN